MPKRQRSPASIRREHKRLRRNASPQPPKPRKATRQVGHYPDGTTLIKEVDRALAFDQSQKLADRKEACKYWAEARFLEIAPPKPSIASKRKCDILGHTFGGLKFVTGWSTGRDDQLAYWQDSCFNASNNHTHRRPATVPMTAEDVQRDEELSEAFRLRDDLQAMTAIRKRAHSIAASSPASTQPGVSPDKLSSVAGPPRLETSQSLPSTPKNRSLDRLLVPPYTQTPKYANGNGLTDSTSTPSTESYTKTPPFTVHSPNGSYSYRTSSTSNYTPSSASNLSFSGSSAPVYRSYKTKFRTMVSPDQVDSPRQFASPPSAEADMDVRYNSEELPGIDTDDAGEVKVLARFQRGVRVPIVKSSTPSPSKVFTLRTSDSESDYISNLIARRSRMSTTNTYSPVFSFKTPPPPKAPDSPTKAQLNAPSTALYVRNGGTRSIFFPMINLMDSNAPLPNGAPEEVIDVNIYSELEGSPFDVEFKAYRRDCFSLSDYSSNLASAGLVVGSGVWMLEVGKRPINPSWRKVHWEEKLHVQANHVLVLKRN